MDRERKVLERLFRGEGFFFPLGRDIKGFPFLFFGGRVISAKACTV